MEQWKSKLITWKKGGVRPNSNEPPCIRHWILQKMFCVGCGTDVSANPKGRRNLTGGGAGAEEVLSAWKSLASGIETGTCIDLSNPGKMCKACFASFQKYYILQEKLEKNLAEALVRIQPSKRQMEPAPSSSPAKRQRVSSSAPPRPLALSPISILSTSSKKSPAVTV